MAFPGQGRGRGIASILLETTQVGMTLCVWCVLGVCVGGGALGVEGAVALHSLGGRAAHTGGKLSRCVDFCGGGKVVRELVLGATA